MKRRTVIVSSAASDDLAGLLDYVMATQDVAAAVALDAWVPAAGHRLEPATVVGSVVALGAVVVAALPGLRRRARPAPLVE